MAVRALSSAWTLIFVSSMYTRLKALLLLTSAHTDAGEDTMNQFLHLSLFISLCFSFPLSIAAEQPSFDIVEYGVGFSLSLDYGTCSVYFANGSTADVAKIEGGTHYKEVMRHLREANATQRQEPSPQGAFLRLQHKLPLPSFLRRALNRWAYRSPDVAAIGSMMHALKVAAESYLGNRVSTADTAVPTSISQSGRQLIDSARLMTGLNRAVGFPTAGQLAATANGIGAFYQHPESCYHDEAPSELILTIDYSRAALTASLYWEELCVFDWLQELHDTELGTTGMDKCRRSSTEDDAGCYQSLAKALEKILKMPPQDEWPDVHLPTEVGGLVLLGEKGTDPHLRRVLQQVLATRVALITSNEPHFENSAMVDPTFAAARGIAAASWGNQNDLSWDSRGMNEL